MKLLAWFMLAKIVSSFNINKNAPTFLRPNDSAIRDDSSFFGYDIQFGFGSDDALNFVIGSPQANPRSNGRSKVYTCSSRTYGSIPPMCATLGLPDDVENSTNLVLTVEDNLDLSACFPDKVFECTNNRLVPGFCYRSINKGRSWNRILPDEELVCPTTSTSNLDLMFVLDGSSSVGSSNFVIVRDWVQEVSRQFNIIDGSTQIGVIQYSSYQPARSLQQQDFIKTEIELGEITDRRAFETKLENIVYLRGQTFTARALNLSVIEFMRSARYRSQNTSKVLVLLTDGRATDSDDLATTAEYVRSLGIKIFAVGVRDSNIAQLQLIATGTATNQSVYFVDNFQALNGIAGELREVISSLALEGDSDNAAAPSSELELAQKGFSSKISGRSVGAIEHV